MTAGRPRKPTQLKVLQGNPGKRKLNKSEPQSRPADPLRAPRWLTPLGKKVWKELAPIAHEMGCLTEADVEMFAHACQQLSVARINPTDTKALEMANKILARFGFTPSDRSKITVEPKTEDPFEDFLSKKGATS